MNLLGILLKSLLADGALKALAKKTGLSTKQLKKVLPLALPLLLKMLTKNASNQEGAASLLGALTQHTSKKTMAQQIEEADTEDGSKIIGHILGNNSQSSLLSLSNQSGLSQQQVSSVLSGIAPALLSGLSAATGSSAASTGNTGSTGGIDLSDGLDLNELMIMLGGPQQQAKPTGLLGSLFGKKPAKEEQDTGINGSDLLQLLLSNR